MCYWLDRMGTWFVLFCSCFDMEQFSANFMQLWFSISFLIKMDFRFRLYFSTNPTFKNPLQNHSSYLVEAVFFEKTHFLKTQFKVCFFCNRLFYSFIIICICLLSYMPFTIYAFYHVCLFPWPPPFYDSMPPKLLHNNT